MYVFCMPYNQCGPSNPVKKKQTKLQLNTEKETESERDREHNSASEKGTE